MTLLGAANFKENAHKAMHDSDLQSELRKLAGGFSQARVRAAADVPEFDALRDAARDIKNHTLANLDYYLERFERKVVENGGKVHWCRTAEEARETILRLCRGLGAKTVTKGKSMIAEEIMLNDHLEKNGIEPVETDLGEYIIQLRHETPSHIIAPAVHLNKEQVEGDFRRVHNHLPVARDLSE
ncbi:MAG: LUD domain-containing protein, partial [Alphaproteobacteria bacterium]